MSTLLKTKFRFLNRLCDFDYWTK